MPSIVLPHLPLPASMLAESESLLLPPPPPHSHSHSHSLHASLVKSEYLSVLTSEFAQRLFRGVPTPTAVEASSEGLSDQLVSALSHAVERLLSPDSSGSPDSYTDPSPPVSNGNTQDETLETNRHAVLITGLAALGAFVQINFTGPTLEMDSLQILSEEWNAVLSSDGSVVLDALAVDGEEVYPLTAQPLLMLISRALLLPLLRTRDAALDLITPYHVASLLLTHQRILSAPAPSLKATISESLTLLDSSQMKSSRLVARCHLLKTMVHQIYRQEAFGRMELDAAIAATGFKFLETGAMGKRTKYQENEYAQLVVLAKSSPLVEHSGALPAEENAPETLALNDDTLLEAIAFSNIERHAAKDPASGADIDPELAALNPGDQPQLWQGDQCILLAMW